MGSTMGGFGFGGGMPYSPSYVPPVPMGAPYTVAAAAPVAAPVTTAAVAETSGSPIPETAPAPAATTVRYAAPAQTYSGFPQMGFGGFGGFGGFQQFTPPPLPRRTRSNLRSTLPHAAAGVSLY